MGAHALHIQDELTHFNLCKIQSRIVSFLSGLSVVNIGAVAVYLPTASLISRQWDLEQKDRVAGAFDKQCSYSVGMIVYFKWI